MLDLGHEQRVSDSFWNTVELKAQLPEEITDFFEKVGPTPVHPNCARAYRRMYLRGKAILEYDKSSIGVYTADASRNGIRFFSPIQLFPKRRGRLRLPNAAQFQVEIIRCQRLDRSCYDCGAVFVQGEDAQPS